MLRRIFSLICATVMLFSCTDALAATRLNLPAAVEEIEEAAFERDQNLNGLVVLPENMKVIRDKAFYGTNLHGIQLPTGLRSVGHQIGSGLIYIKGSGTTAFASDSLLGTRYAFGSAGNSMAEAGAETFYPLSEIIEEGNYIYHIQNGKASLLCVADPDAVNTTERIPKTAGGYLVETICQDAFANCGKIGTIYVPTTAQAESGAFSSVPDAVIRYYSDDFTVEYIECNKAQAMVGDSVIWAAQASESAASYRFDLYNLGGDGSYTEGREYTLVNSTETGKTNHTTLKMDQAGTYAMMVTCTGANGATATRVSAALTVTEGPVKVLSITPEDIILPAGSRCQWNAAYEGGTGAVTCTFTLKKGMQIVASSSGTTLTASNLPEGEYTVTFTVTDGTESSDSIATQCTVVDESAFSPAAPDLTSGNMATNEEDAPVYEQADIEISWAAVDGATGYGLIIEKKENDTWTEVERYGEIRDLSRVISARVLDVEEETLFRIGIYSRNLGDGEPGWYYFRIMPVAIDRQVYINEKTSLTWSRTTINAGTRNFVISSTAEWSATSSSAWVNVKKNQDTLIVEIERNYSYTNRTATVTVSNGYTQAILTVNQGYVYHAPEITWPAMSQDVNNPTMVGTGAPSFQWEKHQAKRVHIQISQKNGNEWKDKFYVRSNGDSYTFANSTNRKLVNGNTYRIRIMAIWDDDYATNEEEGSRLYSDYYVQASSSANYILVNNASDITVDLTDQYTMSEYLNVYASSVYTAESDADWLSYMGTPAGGLTNKCYVKATDNLTGASRTGHVTLQCENATATITVTQEDMTPRMVYPAFSTNESSPTSVKKNDVNLVIYGSSITIEKKSGSSYTDSGITKNLKNTFGCHEIEIETDELQASTTYRVTVSHAGTSKVYYFKTGTASTSYIYVNGFGADDWDAPVSGGTTSVTIKASASWTASSKNGWLTISAQSGSSTTGKTLTVTAAQNTTGQMRTGVIEFKVGSNYTAYLIVNQCANVLLDASFEDSGTKAHAVPGEADNCQVRISHTGKATLTSQADWISCSSASTASSVRLTYEENNTGANRTGTIQVTEDGRTVTLTLTQHPRIPSTSLTSHIISQSSSAPTMLQNVPMTLTWQKVSEATGYRLILRDYDASKIILRDYFTTDQTSFRIPDDVFETGKTYSFYILTLDEYGGSYSGGSYYFMITQPDTVLINKSAAAVWNDVDDYGDSGEFTILAPENWQVNAWSEWLSLSATSGAPGDKITVTAQENLGAARTGTVTITCGNGSAVLTVNQLAYLSQEFQPLLSPDFSTSKATPTILPAGTDSITVNWEVMPQATWYEVEIDKMVSTFSSVTVSSSRLLYHSNGTYTFSNLTLEPGNVYEIQFVRGCRRWGSTGCIYYFIIGDENASIDVDEDEIWLDGDNDYAYVDVTASGAWTATTDAGWVTLTRSYNDEIEEDDPEEYDTFVGSNGASSFCITAKINSTGRARTGKVTLRCGSAVKEITIHQSVYYTYAELTNISLSNTSSNPTNVALDDLNLRWSASSGGTGNYEVTLKKKEGTSYQKVWSRTLNSLNTTIPASVMEEGATYLLFLGTEAVDEDDVYGIRYFFKVKYANELALNITVDWEQISNDTYVYIKAYAGGGSRSGYTYAYQLFKEGVKANESTWMSLDRYNFPVNEAGTYSVKVYLKDSTGTTVTADSANRAVSAEDTGRVTLDTTTWEAAANGGTTNVTVSANNTWTVESTSSWVTAMKISDAVLQLKAAANLESGARTAIVTVKCGKASKIITVTQQGNQPNGSITLSEQNWLLDTVYADEKTVQITSSGEWSVDAGSVPAWLLLSGRTGTSGDNLLIICEANSGAARTATLVITSDGASASLNISQPGNSDTARILSAEVDDITLVGKPTRLRINVRDADSVSVLVNGRVEGAPVTVSNGYQYITHTFETGGDVQVTLIPYRNGAIGAAYDMGTVNIRTFGQLDAPMLQYERVMLQGAAQTVSWNAVTSAENYAVALKYGNQPVKAWNLPGTQTSLELTCMELTEIGTYTIEVSAMAYGYDTGSTAAMITTRMPEINFSITEPTTNMSFVKGDMIDVRVSNPDGYHIAVKVTPDHPSDTNPAVWLPADGSTRSDTRIEGVFLFRPTATDTYTFEAMAWATETRGTEEQAWHDSSRQVRNTINGPTFKNAAVSIDGSGSGVKLRSRMTEVVVETNNAVNQVSLYVDGSATALEVKNQATDYTEDASATRTWRFNINAPAGGSRHTYMAVASDGETEIENTIFAYCVTDVTNKAVYSKSNQLEVYRYPTGLVQDAMHTVDMMEECTLIGTYGSYSYIMSPRGNGFVLSSKVADLIVYDTARITLKMVENQDIDVVYSYIGAPKLTLKWQSNMMTDTGNLVYRIKLQPQSGSPIQEDVRISTVYWNPSIPGNYTVTVSLYDTVKSETVKTVTAYPVYVICSDKQDYINKASFTERASIYTAANTFNNALDYYFDTIDVESYANNPLVKIYQLVDLKLEEFAEMPGSQAEDIAEAILVNLAQNQDATEEVSAQWLTEALSLMGIPIDVMSALQASNYAKDFKDLYRLLESKEDAKKLADKMLEAWKGNHPTLDKIMGKLDKAGKIMTMTTVVLNTIESLANALITIHKFTLVPDEQIDLLVNMYKNSGSSLLQEVAEKLRSYKYASGRMDYAASKLRWTVLQDALEVGKMIVLDSMISTVFGAVMMGVSIGTAISDVSMNSGDITASAARCKWAVNAIREYIPTYTVARKYFIDTPSASSYQTLAKSVIACRQLIMNAYAKMAEFMKAVDDSWFKTADYQSAEESAIRFQGKADELMRMLDNYWATWLQDKCERITLTP